MSHFTKVKFAMTKKEVIVVRGFGMKRNEPRNTSNESLKKAPPKALGFACCDPGVFFVF